MIVAEIAESGHASCNGFDGLLRSPYAAAEALK